MTYSFSQFKCKSTHNITKRKANALAGRTGWYRLRLLFFFDEKTVGVVAWRSMSFWKSVGEDVWAIWVVIVVCQENNVHFSVGALTARWWNHSWLAELDKVLAESTWGAIINHQIFTINQFLLSQTDANVSVLVCCVNQVSDLIG